MKDRSGYRLPVVRSSRLILAGWLSKNAKIGDDAGPPFGRTRIAARYIQPLGRPLWRQYLGSNSSAHARPTLGTESGASVFDLDDATNAALQAVAVNKLGPFREDHQYAESYLAEFADLEDRINYRQLSPRHFEAAATGTLQILYPGNYSNILTAGRHYLPLERDYSNLDAVIDFIRDEPRRSQMTKTAREEIILNRKYWIETFVERFDDRLDEELQNAPSRSYSKSGENTITEALAALKSQILIQTIPALTKKWKKLPEMDSSLPPDH